MTYPESHLPARTALLIPPRGLGTFPEAGKVAIDAHCAL